MTQIWLKPLIKKILAALAALVTALHPLGSINALGADFSDVPVNHWSYEYVNSLRELGITDGVGGNNFGLGQSITRAEFAAFLCKLMDWPLTNVGAGFTDNSDTGAWYYAYLETAFANGAVTDAGSPFRPNAPITRSEMAVMLVRALGCGTLAEQIAYLGSPFSDVTNDTGYITIARDLGIISGVGDNLFMPDSTATREQAAVMLVRMHNILENTLDFTNGFYAISSASQKNAIQGLDSVCFGWARLSASGGTVSLDATTANGNEYYIPSGYEEPYRLAAGRERMLMIAIDNTDARNILSDPAMSAQATALMAETASGLKDAQGNILVFDGIVVDFEGLKGEDTKAAFNAFLTDLDAVLESGGKAMYVAVHPQRREGHEYYDAYDYRTIGDLADKVILMAHDYNTRSLTSEEIARGVVMTPVAPIDEVYYALRAITDANTGVRDKSKIVLQLSFGSAQWKLLDGQVVNQQPYTPSYEAIINRMAGGAELKYDKRYESPYITFHNYEDGTDNVVWYEDERSVLAKTELAKLFGISGVSLWRLGIVPDNDNYNLDVLDMLIRISI